MEQGIYGDGECIYCRSYAGVPEEQVIAGFNEGL